MSDRQTEDRQTIGHPDISNIIGNHNIYVCLTTRQAKLLKQIIDSWHRVTQNIHTHLRWSSLHKNFNLILLLHIFFLFSTFVSFLVIFANFFLLRDFAYNKSVFSFESKKKTPIKTMPKTNLSLLTNYL